MEWSVFFRPSDIIDLVMHYIEDDKLRQSAVTALQGDGLQCGQKADIARVVAMYAKGGFYRDPDNWLERSLDPLLLASLLLVPGIMHSVDANFFGADAQDLRMLDLLRMQLRAAVGRRGLTKWEQVDVIHTTAPGLFSKWTKKHCLFTKPLASRWVPVARGKGPCKAALVDINDQFYGLRVQVEDAFVTAYHAWGWASSKWVQCRKQLPNPRRQLWTGPFTNWNTGRVSLVENPAPPAMAPPRAISFRMSRFSKERSQKVRNNMLMEILRRDPIAFPAKEFSAVRTLEQIRPTALFRRRKVH